MRGYKFLDRRKYNKRKSIKEYETIIKQVLRNEQRLLTKHTIFNILSKQGFGLNIWQEKKRVICYQTVATAIDRLFKSNEIVGFNKNFKSIAEIERFQRVTYQLPSYEFPGQKLQRKTTEHYRESFLKEKNKTKYPVSIVIKSLSDNDKKIINELNTKIAETNKENQKVKEENKKLRKINMKLRDSLSKYEKVDS